MIHDEIILDALEKYDFDVVNENIENSTILKYCYEQVRQIVEITLKEKNKQICILHWILFNNNETAVFLEKNGAFVYLVLSTEVIGILNDKIDNRIKSYLSEIFHEKVDE